VVDVDEDIAVLSTVVVEEDEDEVEEDEEDEIAVGTRAAVGVVKVCASCGNIVKDEFAELVDIDIEAGTKGVSTTVVVDGESTSIIEYLIDIAVVGEGVIVTTRVLVVSGPSIVFVVTT
jgi:hypothetical protein